MTLGAERLAPSPRGTVDADVSSSSTASPRHERSWAAIGASPCRATATRSSPSTHPGHGESAAVQVDLVAGADLLGRAAGPATYVGYSMGGRLALHLAVSRPDLVERLVLVSSTAGIDDDRRARCPPSRPTNSWRHRSSVTASPPFSPTGWRSRCSPTCRPTPRGSTTASGTLLRGWRRACASPAPAPRSRCGRASQSLPMPVLLVAGQLDAKFAAIAERMAALIPDATLAVIAGAGHAVHLERPAEFLEVLRRWLDATPVGPADRDAGRLSRRAAARASSGRRTPAAAGRSRRARRSAPGRRAPPTTCRTGDTASSDGAERRAAPPAARSPRRRRGRRTWPRRARRRATASAASPSRTASVRLPATVSVGMSRRLLTTSSAQARQPAAQPIDDAQPGDLLDADVGRADRGDEPEEHEHEHLAEPQVAVRPRPAGVEPGRGDARRARRRAATTTSSPRAPGRRTAATPNARQRRPLDRPRRRQPRRHQPQRADPAVVGARARRRSSRWRSSRRPAGRG